MKKIAWLTYGILSGAILGFLFGWFFIILSTLLAIGLSIAFTGDISFPQWSDRLYESFVMLTPYVSSTLAMVFNTWYIYQHKVNPNQRLNTDALRSATRAG